MMMKMHLPCETKRESSRHHKGMRRMNANAYSAMERDRGSHRAHCKASCPNVRSIGLQPHSDFERMSALRMPTCKDAYHTRMYRFD